MQRWTLLLPAVLWIWLASKTVTRSRQTAPTNIIIVHPGIALALGKDQ